MSRSITHLPHLGIGDAKAIDVFQYLGLKSFNHLVLFIGKEGIVHNNNIGGVGGTQSLSTVIQRCPGMRTPRQEAQSSQTRFSLRRRLLIPPVMCSTMKNLRNLPWTTWSHHHNKNPGVLILVLQVVGGNVEEHDSQY